MKDKRPMTDAERTRKHRQKRNNEGWRLIQIYLEPRSSEIIESMEKQGFSLTTAVNRCILACKRFSAF
jgi:hypothetical protein